MKRTALFVMFGVAGAMRAQAGGIYDAGPSVMPTISREMRAVWMTTVSNLDWPSNTTRTTAQQQAEVTSLLDLCVQMNLNTIFLQVRSQADSLYPSSIEPWGPMFRGTMGLAPSPSYDPLDYWVQQAHQRGLQIYAWFNPYRALSSSGTSAPANHISKVSAWVDTYPTSATNNAIWIDPGGGGSTQTRNVIKDVVTRYDIDGVVFDDYFYPYPYGTNAYPDSDTYGAYTSAGGTLSLKEWRIKNVNDLVQAVNLDIKAIKPYMKFGIGPFGIYRSYNASTSDGRPAMPSPVVGLNAVDSIYCDSVKFLSEGWIDFLAPQIYWTIGATSQPHVTIMNWWAGKNPLGRNIYVSNYTANVAAGTWTSTELINQITEARANTGIKGNVHFRMGSLRDATTLKNTLISTTYASQALIPTHPWIDAIAPLPPIVNRTTNAGANTQTISWTPFGLEAPTWYTVAYLVGSTWTTKIYTPATTSVTIPLKSASGALRAYGVASVDRSGNQSTWSQIILDPSVLGGQIRD